MSVKELLDTEWLKRNCDGELCELTRPDPLIVARDYKDEYISLACALFAYGKASLIVKFLRTIDFELLNESQTEIQKALSSHYYRFQTTGDIIMFISALASLRRDKIRLNEIFLDGYKQNSCVTDGVSSAIKQIKERGALDTQGYEFLLGNEHVKKSGSPLKRWMMYLRWMVRQDELDMGLWHGIDKADLILPLDTHTFNVSKRIGLLESGSYNLGSAIKITEKLKTFDPKDPIKYDFALYRIGQEKLA